MGTWPQILPKDLVALFGRVGFTVIRQTGSHARLAHADGRKITIAIHSRPVPIGTLFAILRQAQISKAEFRKLLGEK